MTLARKITSIILALLTALMLLVTLTIPAIAAAGPAILTVALGAVTFFMWPRKRGPA